MFSHLQSSGFRRSIKKDSYRAGGNHPDTKDSTSPAQCNSRKGHPCLSRIRKERCFGRSRVERQEGKPQAQGRALRGFPRLARCEPRVILYPGGEHAKQGAKRRGKTASGKRPRQILEKRVSPRMTFAHKPSQLRVTGYPLQSLRHVRGNQDRRENLSQFRLRKHKPTEYLLEGTCARGGTTGQS